MSLITQCTACHTLFRVVPDQLKISQGWVRCGKCEEIFNASEHLQALGGPAENPADILSNINTQANVSEELPFSESGSDGQLDGVDDHTQVPGFDLIFPEPSPPAPDLDLDFPAQVADLDVPKAASDSQAMVPSELGDANGYGEGVHDQTVVSDPPGSDLKPESLVEVQLNGPDAVPGNMSFQNLLADAVDRLEAEHPPVEVLPGRDAAVGGENGLVSTPEVTFVQPPAKVRPIFRPGVVALRSGLLVLLLITLGLQWLRHERNHLATYYPAFAPAIGVMCGWMSCDIQPLQNIEAVVIESSAFNKIQADVYRLQFTVRNSAAVPIAQPALELVLTDLHDQPVLRRVLLPAELGYAMKAFLPGGELTANVPLRVASEGQPERVAGYRITAFYP